MGIKVEGYGELDTILIGYKATRILIDFAISKLNEGGREALDAFDEARRSERKEWDVTVSPNSIPVDYSKLPDYELKFTCMQR
jgi:hypothetical protein